MSSRRCWRKSKASKLAESVANATIVGEGAHIRQLVRGYSQVRGWCLGGVFFSVFCSFTSAIPMRSALGQCLHSNRGGQQATDSYHVPRAECSARQTLTRPPFSCVSESESGPLGRFWAVTVLSAWALLGCHGAVRLVGFGPSWCCPFVLGCHGVVCLVGCSLSRCCPLGRFWAVTVLSAWSVLGCYGIVRLVRLGGFGLSWCCPLGRFWAVTVLFAWAVLGCHGAVRLVGFGLSRCCPLGPFRRFRAVTVLSVWSVLGYHNFFA